MVNWHQRLRWLPLLMMMGLIFYLSHLPGNSIHLPHFSNSDKLAHAGVYCMLGLSYLYALLPRWRLRSLGLACGSVVLFCLLFGLSDEFHQSFVPGRDVSGGDVMADIAGGAIAWILFASWRLWRKTTVSMNE